VWYKNKPLQLAFACGTNLRRENLTLKCSWAPPDRRERKIEKKIINTPNIACRGSKTSTFTPQASTTTTKPRAFSLYIMHQ